MKKGIKILLTLVVILLVIFSAVFWVLSIKKTEAKLVVLISIDTLRADHVGCYNSAKKTTPNIDIFSKESIIFENTIAPAPLTLPSHSSMLTGTLPLYHGVRDNEGYKLNSSIVTIAELLKENGFSTCGIASSDVIRKTTGIEQGFDTYFDKYEDERKDTYIIGRRADDATKLACEWLNKPVAEKRFLFIHYFDPHTPYDPPGELAEQYKEYPYDGEIKYTDDHIGILINKIKELGLYEESLIILTSDHGEMLGGHGETEHGFFVYEGAIKVPLLVKLPGKKTNKRVQVNVGLIDIMPTICEIVGIDAPQQNQGISLLDKKNFQAATKDERYLYCESLFPTRYGGNSIFGVINRQWKYIQTSKPELYDVKKDPKERINIISKELKRTELLKKHLKDIIVNKAGNQANKSKVGITDDMQKLESLGYLGGGSVVEDMTFEYKGIDPKDLIHRYEQQKIVQWFMRNDKYQEAKKVCTQLVEAYPDSLHFTFKLYEICMKLEDYDHIIKYFDKMLSRLETTDNPLNKQYKAPVIDAHSKLAEIYYKKEDMTKVEAHLKKILDIDQNNTFALNEMGDLFLENGETKRALENYNRSLIIDPEQISVYHKLSRIYAAQEKYIEAEEYLKKAIEIDSQKAESYFNLANVCYIQNRYKRAMLNYEKAYSLNPDLSEAKRRADICRKQVDMIDTISILNDAIDKDPKDHMLYKKLGGIYFKLKKYEFAAYQWEESLALKPEQIDLLNNLSWIMLTKENDKVFDPEKAIEYALEAAELTENKVVEVLDTLMLAYASNGDYVSAIETGQKALVLARESNKAELAKNIQEKMASYKLKVD